MFLFRNEKIKKTPSKQQLSANIINGRAKFLHAQWDTQANACYEELPNLHVIYVVDIHDHLRAIMVYYANKHLRTFENL